MPRLIGIDTGGTYTDAVVFDPEAGVLAAAKALTTKHDLALGVGEALETVLPPKPSEVALVSLSTTLATNAIVEGHGSPVCLLMIGGKKDALTRSGLGEALAGDPVAFLAGGHDAHGEETAALDLEAARASIAEHAPKVAAFAVCGTFGVRNPAHEQRLRDLIREETGLPVTCGHELTRGLDAPRRAMTAVLNARLIPLLQQLVLSVRELMARHAIAAPLMVVKGDGSLIAAEAALARPIETILSGPAASVVGARHLSGQGDVLVSDIGGTTTDIALLSEGRPALSPDGATVGGWRTMVEAIAVHTVGLGGDSEARLDETGALALGPRRALPLSLLARDRPAVLETLRRQAARSGAEDEDGRFALRLRPLDAPESSLTSGERKVWQALAEGPVALSDLLADHHLARPLDRLVGRGLVIRAAFTPSDAAHLLGLQDDWAAEAARLGAALWLRHLPRKLGIADGEAFARAVFERVVVQSGRALAVAALTAEHQRAPGGAGPLSTALLERGLERRGDPARLLDVALELRRPVVAIGAPAATYYAAIAERLGTEAIVPPHAGVTNAVGAVAGGVSQRARILVSQPKEGRFRVHGEATRDFAGQAAALAAAEDEARTTAEALARGAGAEEIEIRLDREEKIVAGVGGQEIFVDCEIVATATGRPRLATG